MTIALAYRELSMLMLEILRFTSPVAALMAIGLAGCSGPPRPVQSDIPVSLDAVPVVYGLGRHFRTTVSVDETSWQKVSRSFEPPAADPVAERQQIRRAVTLMEQIVGEQTPTSEDLARNTGPRGSVGQMDCIDESTNTTTYLRLFAERGLLRWHEVLEPAFRAPMLLLDPHYSAQVRDVETGDRFVIDTWFRDNGQPPYVQRLDDWHRKKPFSDDENPSLEVDLSARD